MCGTTRNLVLRFGRVGRNSVEKEDTAGTSPVKLVVDVGLNRRATAEPMAVASATDELEEVAVILSRF